MAYVNVQTSGKLRTASAAGLSWAAAAPTLNNLLTYRGHGWKSGGYVPAATDVKDSSGTPKVYAKDVSTTVVPGEAVTIHTLVVPSGLTTPLKNVNAATVLVGIFDEWSGGATSSQLDVSNSKNTGTLANGTITYTGATINTGANAGLVLAVMASDDATTEVAADPTTTGTSFVQDAHENDGSGFAFGSEDHRVTSVASQTGLGDTWLITNAGTNEAALDCIASYNLVGAASTMPPGLGPVEHMDVYTMSAIAAMMR